MPAETVCLLPICELIELRNLLFPKAFIDGFEHQRHIVEAGVLGNIAEALPANLARA